jgi:hypothetical protein
MYLYILCPIIAFTIAQGLKVFLKSLKHKLSWHDVFAYSDMPSGHTAVVTSLVAILGLKLGLGSPIFATAFVFATIVITDAIGLRNYLGQHGRTLNILVKDLKEDEFLDNSYPKLLEHIGHTPMQVIIGTVIGLLTSLLGFLLF